MLDSFQITSTSNLPWYLKGSMNLNLSHTRFIAKVFACKCKRTSVILKLDDHSYEWKVKNRCLAFPRLFLFFRFLFKKQFLGSCTMGWRWIVWTAQNNSWDGTRFLFEVFSVFFATTRRKLQKLNVHDHVHGLAYNWHHWHSSTLKNWCNYGTTSNTFGKNK